MARFLVTGGAGFIGSHLVDLLVARGDGVIVFDDLSSGRRDRIHDAAVFVKGDVADAACIYDAFEGVDGCFHLAAIASVDVCNAQWLQSHRINLGGAIAVFDAARAHGGVPVVYASSAAVYGANQDAPLTEDAMPAPLSAYGADKLGCELHARAAHEVHGIPTTGLRFFNVYGPRQDPTSPYSGVISAFASRLSHGETATIHGDGEQTRDFIYVADVCRALAAAMAETGGARVYNVCTGGETSINKLADVLKTLTGNPHAPAHGPARGGDVRRSLGDASKLSEATGWHAEVALETGLAATLDWMRSET